MRGRNHDEHDLCIGDGSGEVRHNAFMLKFTTGDHEFTVFPDGRAIIKGTNDIARARTLYAQFVGN